MVGLALESSAMSSREIFGREEIVTSFCPVSVFFRSETTAGAEAAGAGAWAEGSGRAGAGAAGRLESETMPGPFQ